MDEINLAFEEFLKNQSTQIPLLSFSINLIIAATLSWLLSKIYIKYSSSVSNRKIFAKNLMLLSVTTMVIISIVKSSLALSLGLVGALSIIRFRTAIKEPEELVYLFMAITIGLGLGADQVKTVVTAFVLITLLIILGKKNSKSEDNSSLFLTLSSNNESFNIESLGTIVSKHCTGVKLKRYDNSNEEQQTIIESVFQISVTDIEDLEKLRLELKKIDSEIRISIIDETGIIL